MLDVIKKYDALISLVENNILQDTKVLVEMACKELVLSDRKMNEFFYATDPEGRRFREYVKIRKHLRAMGDFAKGKTKEQVCEKYNLETSRFSDTVKKNVNGKTPKQLREDGYTCPDPIYLSGYWKERDCEMSLDSSPSKENEKKYIEEIVRLNDLVLSLQTTLAEEREQNLSKNNTQTNIIDESTYSQFLEIEEKRIVYGLTVSTVLALFNKSLKSEKSFDQLCDEAQDCYLAGEEVPWFLVDENERLNYHLDYELDTGETWDYYYGDDDPADLPHDPYANNNYDENSWYEKPYDIAIIDTDYEEDDMDDYEGDDMDDYEGDDIDDHEETEQEELISHLFGEKIGKRPEVFDDADDDDIPF